MSAHGLQEHLLLPFAWQYEGTFTQPNGSVCELMLEFASRCAKIVTKVSEHNPTYTSGTWRRLFTRSNHQFRLLIYIQVP